MRHTLTFLSVTLFLFALAGCSEKPSKPLTADQVVTRAIDSSGGDLYRTSQVSFVFRDREYRYYRDGGQRVYERLTQTDSGLVRDILHGGNFRREVADREVPLPDSLQLAYGNSVNSVHYFAYLPFGLNDPAVNRELLGESELEGERYYKVRVTFDREGGGTDYDDVFVYWFNTRTYLPDYLAYAYHTNGGGLRFRKAYNPRVVAGIRFQDYINYKADKEASVEALDSLFLAGKLEELSRVELKDIRVTPGSYN